MISALAGAPGQVSSGNHYCCPEFVEDGSEPQILIKAGRHPMLDAFLSGGSVPNDTTLRGGDDQQNAMLVTGPNMGGKSCFIRQTALLVLMSKVHTRTYSVDLFRPSPQCFCRPFPQIGCYVPAEACKLHVVDCIYTRMGASDNLAAGSSTFQVELTEASHILANATPRR